MSSGGNPPLSPFVRGTTDQAHVFFLQGTVRRPVPDNATLKLMLGGQTVRVLTDAALAAIPLGTPLPSRADGTLLMQHFPVPPPAPVYYFMKVGQRRRVPDPATAHFLALSLPASAVDVSDLTAIPEGPPLPTRADNAVYRGTRGAFAYILTGGQKRWVPNATTLRDSGHDVGRTVADQRYRCGPDSRWSADAIDQPVSQSVPGGCAARLTSRAPGNAIPGQRVVASSLSGRHSYQ